MKLRKIGKSFLAAFLSLCMMSMALTGLTLPAAAATATSGATGDCTWTLDAAALTISGSGAMENYTTASAAPWGADITEVVIENGVTSIGNYAFSNCDKIKSVKLADGITSIGEGAFYNCRSLISAELPESVKTIESYAFKDCVNLASITIPNGVEIINDGTFYECFSLASVIIPASVKTIGALAFYDCISLETVYYCGADFEYSKISIDNENEYLTEAAKYYHNYDNDSDMICNFCGYTRANTYGFLTYAVNNEEVTITGCNKTVSGEIIIPSSIEGYPVTSIGDKAFENCKEITSVNIPDGVTSIGDYAFYCCYELKSVDIPNSVASIGFGAFNNCQNLSNIKMGDGVTSIGCEAFNECLSLKSIVIPNGVTQIRTATFAGCINLKRVIIPDGVTVIGDLAFADCTNLSSVVIPNSVTRIVTYAFSGCENLKTIYYSGTKQQWNAIIDEDAFDGYVNVKYCEAHDYQTIVVEPTCTEGGYTKNACIFCGYETIDENSYVSATGHSYEETSRIEPTQDTVGFVTKTCVNCDDTFTQELQALGHNFKSTVTAPTCTEKGYTTYTCEDCGYSYKVDIEPVGHNYIKHSAKCEETWCGSGDYSNSYYICYVTYKCTYCGDTKKQQYDYVSNGIEETMNLPSIGHVHIITYLCPACDKTHKYFLWKPSTTIDGVYYKDGEHRKGELNICECGEEWEYYDWFDGYLYEVVGMGECDSYKKTVVAPTCTTEGYTIQQCEHKTIKVDYVPAQHTYDSDFDAVCNSCGFTRSGIEGSFLYSINNNMVTITRCEQSVSGDIIIPSTIEGYPVTRIGSSAFADCRGLTSVTIPDSVTSISSYAFVDCSSLTSIIIPNGITSIGEGTFWGCSSLTSVAIPNSVTSISSYAFEDCSSLRTVYYCGTAEQWNNIHIGPCNLCLTDATRYSHYYDGDLDVKCNACGNTRVPTSTDYSFLTYTVANGEVTITGCNDIAKGDIILPSKLGGYPVTSIGEMAFFDCDGITSLSIPNSVTNIENLAFFDCGSIVSISIPNSVTSIGLDAFADCTSLKSVYYRGSENDKSNLNVDDSNTSLSNANWYYNSCVWSIAHIYTNVCDADCNFCEETREASHKYESTVTAPTCTSGGFTAHTCSACGDIYKTNEIAAFGHKFNSIVTAPTFTSQGYTTHTCAVCGYSYKDNYTAILTGVQNMQITATDTNITATWDTLSGVTKYILYVKNKAGETIITRALSADRTSVTLSWPNDIEWDKTYTIGIRAKTTKWLDTVWKDAALTVANRIVDVRTESVGRTIKVDWKAYEGATQYYVYVYKKGEYPTAFSAIEVNGKNSVSIINAIYAEVDYEVRVIATKGVTKMKTIDAIPVAARLNVFSPDVFIERGTTPTAVAVSWDEIRGVDKCWTYLTPVNGGETIIRESKRAIVGFYNLTPNTTYNVQIQARIVDANGVAHYSGMSDVLGTISTTDWSDVSIIATASDNGANLVWTAPEGAYEYAIYRSPNGGKSYGELAIITDPAVSSYVDTKAKSGYIYAIIVRLKDDFVAVKSPLIKSNPLA